jgi:hypothetical protein
MVMGDPFMWSWHPFHNQELGGYRD